MKKNLLVVCVIGLICFQSCKQTEKTPVKNTVKVETPKAEQTIVLQDNKPNLAAVVEQQKSKQEIRGDSGNFSMIVSFYSIGSGIDIAVAKEFDYLVKDFQEQYGDEFISEKVGWGREGEVDFCIQLDKLKSTVRESFKNRADTILKKAIRVHVSENAPCLHRRR